MTPQQRLALYTRDLNIVISTPDSILIFTQKGVAENYVQFNQRVGEPLHCESTTRNWNGELPPLGRSARARLAGLGYELPKPKEKENASKKFDGAPRDLALEVEKIFREVFELPEDYEVMSSGVFQ